MVTSAYLFQPRILAISPAPVFRRKWNPISQCISGFRDDVMGIEALCFQFAPTLIFMLLYGSFYELAMYLLNVLLRSM